MTIAGLVHDDAGLAGPGDARFPVLRIERCAISSLTGVIGPWPALKRVALIGLAALRDITALRLLPNLEELCIVECGYNDRYERVARTLDLKSCQII